MSIDYSVYVDLLNTKLTPFEITVKGIIVEINKKKYLICPHKNLDIEYIKFNDKIYNNFKYGYWTNIIAISIDNILPHQYVFKQFVKKHIDDSVNYYIYENDDMKCNYMGDEYTPLYMLPNYPTNMYYKFHINNDDLLTGTPIFTKKKYCKNILVGITIYNEDNTYQVLPYIYIYQLINKDDNNLILPKKYNDLIKINKNIVKKNKIYCHSLKSYINIDSYLVLYYKKNDYCYYSTKNNNFKKPFNTFDFTTKISKKNSVVLTPQLFHYFHTFNQDIFMKIISGEKIITYNDYIIKTGKMIQI
jgi:hypothetical protein